MTIVGEIIIHHEISSIFDHDLIESIQRYLVVGNKLAISLDQDLFFYFDTSKLVYFLFGDLFGEMFLLLFDDTDLFKIEIKTMDGAIRVSTE